MKSEQITTHGQFIDSINYNALIKSQAEQETFKGNLRKVVSVKTTSKAKSYSKVKKPSQRHR